MKRLLRIGCMITCCLFMLGGCKKQDAQELVLNTYESWKQMNMDVWSVGPAMAGSDFSFVHQVYGGTYWKVDDERFHSVEDIKEATEEICTESGAEKMFYDKYLTHKDQAQSPMYCEEDGNLFRLEAEIPFAYGGDLTDFRVLEEKEDAIHAEMEFSDDDLERSYTIDITIVKENGKWLVDDLVQKDL